MTSAVQTSTTQTSTTRAELPFPAIWLRDNCPCPGCRDPRNGQKLFGILDLPTGLTVDAVDRSAGSVTVTFGPDGHRSTFDADWLDAQREPSTGDGRTELGKQLWVADDLAGRLPVGVWASYRADDEERLRVLRAVQGLGFAILRETPTDDRTVLRVAESFGFVRETNYGDLFEVRVEADPNNLAYTGLAIGPHTDNPYRDPVPTMQLLHCLSNAVGGGESGLVDGFRAAATLRDEEPAAYDVLTSTPVPFAWSDAHASLRAERPLIGVDPQGGLREVRFNNRSMQPLRLPYDDLVAFYAAYRSFAAIIERPELLLTFRLEPGDCLIFDNVRLLHARTAFADSGTGARHLQGCYADLDGLNSTVTLLGGGS
ncbi:MAG: 2-trimethylaminoethylphosphonate dioxygenase [Nocardioidaceae bacterium]